MSSQPLRQLDYAPIHPRWYRRKPVRYAIIPIVGLLLLLASANWLRPAIPIVLRAYHRHECMIYTAPPDRVVYESNPAKAKALMASDRRYEILLDNDRRACYFSCLPWEKHGAANANVLFMHRLRRPDGQERLVAILFRAQYAMSGLYPYNYVEVPGRQPSSNYSSSAIKKKFSGLTLDRNLRVFAGQIDPADESHFTIAYEARGQRGTVDGWLLNDDTVKATVRDGPAK